MLDLNTVITDVKLQRISLLSPSYRLKFSLRTISTVILELQSLDVWYTRQQTRTSN